MKQWDFNDGIVPFLICIAMCVFVAVMPPLWERWKEARRKLEGWSEYQIRIEAPDAHFENIFKGTYFQAISKMLSELGFESVGDYVLTSGIQVQSLGPNAPLASPDTTEKEKKFRFAYKELSRIFEHRQHGCVVFASLSVDWNKKGGQILRVVSVNKEWTYTSAMGGALGIDVGQSSRGLKSNHVVDSIEQLIETHLQCRTKIAHAGNFTWDGPMTMEEVFHHEEQYVQAVREFGRRHSPLSLWRWERRMKRQEHRDWLGELTGKVSLPKNSVS